MSGNISETIERWYGAAAQERADIYAKVGLKPVKKAPSYRLVVDKLAGLNGDLKKLSDVLTTAFQGGAQSKAYTVIEPRNNRYARSKKTEKPKAEDSFNLSVPFYKQYGENTVVLTQNSNRDIEAYEVIGDSCKKLSIVIEDATVRQQIGENIHKGTELTSTQHAAVVAALVKQGYLIDSNSPYSRIQSGLEKRKFLGQPILVRDEVNCFNAYQSWYDFFNDIKAVVVKPLTALFLTMNHFYSMLFSLGVGVDFVRRGQEGGLAQFDLAAQSLVKALIYGLMTRDLVIVVAQLLSIMSRLIMSIPGMITATPELINACTREGSLTVARRGAHSFATGFCGMFSTTARQEEVMTPINSATQTDAERAAAMRNARNARYASM